MKNDKQINKDGLEQKQYSSQVGGRESFKKPTEEQNQNFSLPQRTTLVFKPDQKMVDEASSFDMLIYNGSIPSSQIRKGSNVVIERVCCRDQKIFYKWQKDGRIEWVDSEQAKRKNALAVCYFYEKNFQLKVTPLSQLQDE